MKFKKRVFFRPAFDKRNKDPKKDYGIHGVELIMTLIGEKAAVSFVLFTNWQLPHVQAENEIRYHDHLFCRPLPADIGYHSPYPMYKDQQPRTKVCEYIGVPCYTDGSASYAEEFYQELVTNGSKGFWKKMKEYYRARFEKENSNGEII